MDSIFNLICSVVIMVLLMGFVKDIRGPHLQRKDVIILITFNKNSNIEPVLGLCLVSLLVASACWWDPGAVGQGQNNGGESFQERAQSNVCLWWDTKKITFCAHSEASIYLAALAIFLCEEVYLQTRLLAPVWLVYESFLWEEFSVKVGSTKPKKSHNLAG